MTLVQSPVNPKLLSRVKLNPNGGGKTRTLDKPGRNLDTKTEGIENPLRRQNSLKRRKKRTEIGEDLSGPIPKILESTLEVFCRRHKRKRITILGKGIFNRVEPFGSLS